MDACFIHRVQPVEATPGFSSKSAQKWQKNRIIFFDTYAGAALAAHKLDLLSRAATIQIAQECVKVWYEVCDPTKMASEVKREKRRVELNQDLAAVKDYLSKTPVSYVDIVAQNSFRMQTWPEPVNAKAKKSWKKYWESHDDIELIPAVCKWKKGTAISIYPFGPGRVTEFRAIDGVYEVSLMGSLGWRPIGQAADHDLDRSDNIKSVAKMFVSVQNTDIQLLFPIHAAVLTSFGTGIIEQIRSDSD